jgi:hypothetical protein
MHKWEIFHTSNLQTSSNPETNDLVCVSSDLKGANAVNVAQTNGVCGTCGIQELYKRQNTSDNIIKTLQQENNMLKARLDKMEKLINMFSQQ